MSLTPEQLANLALVRRAADEFVSTLMHPSLSRELKRHAIKTVEQLQQQARDELTMARRVA